MAAIKYVRNGEYKMADDTILYKQTEKEMRANVHLCCLRWGSNSDELLAKFRRDNEGRPDRPVEKKQ